LLPVILIFHFPEIIFSQNAGVTHLPEYTACPGTNITLPMTISNSPLITSISLRIDFDGSVLSFVSAKNTNPTLAACGGSITGAQSPLGGALTAPHRLMLTWFSVSGNGCTITSGGTGTLCNLNFKYYGGNTSLVFNNTIHYGQDCEYSDDIGNALNDSPSSTFYFNGSVSQVLNLITPGEISGPSSVFIGTYETYTVLNVSGLNYLWSFPTGWTGSSTSNSITLFTGSNSGDISVFSSNICGMGQVLSLYVNSTLGIPEKVEKEFSIKNFPNPVNGITVFEFENPVPGQIKIDLYSVNGSFIGNLTDQFYMEGLHSLSFDTGYLRQGNYLYLLEFRQKKKVFTCSNILQVIK